MRIIFDEEASPHILRRAGPLVAFMLSCCVTAEMAMGFWLFVIVSIGSIPLAGAMARERNRPSRRWLWIAVAVGPLAPLALLILGDAKRPASAN
ncbi:hypothetical protein JQ594_31965 [Bradyrhizobium manausense]|nr:hypothetical protein [Bradyrhizobium manausense]